MSTPPLISSSTTKKGKNNGIDSNNVIATKIDDYIQRLSDDHSVSLTQKNACFKTLSAVLKNLIDPKKGGVAGKKGLNKYRKFKSNNPKLKSRMFCSESITACVTDLLMDPNLIGMTRELKPVDGNDNTKKGSIIKLIMEDPPSAFIRDVIGLRVLPSLRTAQSVIALQIIARSISDNTTREPPTTYLFAGKDHWEESSLSSSVPKLHRKYKLSEKKKTSRMLDSKELLERKQNKFDKIRTDTKVQIADVDQAMLTTVTEESNNTTWSSMSPSSKPCLVAATERRY